MFHTNDIFSLQHKNLGIGIALSFAFSEGKMKFSNTVKIFSIQIPSDQTWSVVASTPIIQYKTSSVVQKQEMQWTISDFKRHMNI